MMQKRVDKPKTRPYNNVIDGTQSRRIHRRLRRGVCEWCFSFFLLFIKKGAVSKWLKQAMRGSAFFRNIFGQAKTECRKNGTQGIIFIRNSKWNEL